MRQSCISLQRGLTAATLCALAGLLALPSLPSAQEATSNDEVFSATAKANLPTGTQIKSFDISYVDPTLSTYVLGDRTNKSVDVVNTQTLGATLLTANPPFAGAATSCPDGNNNDCSGPDGVIIIPAANNGDHLNEVWAGDGPTASCVPGATVPFSDPQMKCSTVKVIDLASGLTKHVIATGGEFRADESCFDSKDNLFMTANNADNPPFGTIISTVDYTIKSQIRFTNSTNGAEQCQWSPRTGMFYITIPGVKTPDDGTGVVEVIDPKSGTIVNTFQIPLQDCSTPQGLAVGPNGQIMVGCNGAHGTTAGDSGNGLHSGIIINEQTGAVTKVIPNESGPDEVYYNAGDGQYFLARSAAVGANQLLGVVDANGGKADQSVVTANKTIPGRNAHSVAADAGTNKVFVPIPAGVSTVCSSVGGTDANGCIAVFTASPDDKGKAIVGRND